jgi:uncharacterized UBP type Zn finger protein
VTPTWSENVDTNDADDRCEHFQSVGNPAPTTKGCAECMALGEKWVALRVCLSCGHVGCCEDSPHAHALAHFQATGHPIIRPLERGPRWTWCYIHHRYFGWMPDSTSGAKSGGSAFSGWLRRFGRK